MVIGTMVVFDLHLADALTQWDHVLEVRLSSGCSNSFCPIVFSFESQGDVVSFAGDAPSSSGRHTLGIEKPNNGVHACIMAGDLTVDIHSTANGYFGLDCVKSDAIKLYCYDGLTTHTLSVSCDDTDTWTEIYGNCENGSILWGDGGDKCVMTV